MSTTDEFDSLLSVAEELAHHFVDEHGVAPPFAVLLLPDGTATTVALQSRTETTLRAVELVDGLIRNLRERASRGEFRAVAVCATRNAGPVDTGERACVILIGLEAPGRAPESIVIPYSRGLLGSFVFHPVVRQPGRSVVFLPGEGHSEPEG